MNTSLAPLLTRYLAEYLPAQRNLSVHTIRSYRDTFVLLLRYCRDHRALPPERMKVGDLTAGLVTAFLDHLEQDRQCAIATRNQRLAALHSFTRYIQAECPEAMLELQRILIIPSKRHERREVRYLSADEMTAILRQPGQDTSQGRRDTLLLSLLYDTGARAQELIDLRVRDVRLAAPAQVQLTGKGRKTRHVPLLSRTVRLLEEYFRERDLQHPGGQESPLFANRYGECLTRSGIRHILQKYTAQARAECPTIPESLSPHTLRHTKAMHLLEAGNPLVIIGNILGHADIKSTQIYAKADMKMKRQALESISTVASPPGPTTWQSNKNLLDWLKSL